MPKARLNLKQRQWRDRFLEKYPYYRVRDIWEDLAGDRVIVFEGTEHLEVPLVIDYEGEYPVCIHHKLKIKLRVYGDPRYSAEHQWKIATSKDAWIPKTGQLVLPIQQALAIPQPTNPVIVTWKPKQAREKKNVQLSIPVFGVEAELFQHRLKYRPHLPPISSQEILAEKISTWSIRDKREVELPQAVVDVLRTMGANDEEWQSAMDLFEVAGIPCAMEYAQGLPTFRRWKGLPEMPLVIQSQAVQSTTTHQCVSAAVLDTQLDP